MIHKANPKNALDYPQPGDMFVIWAWNQIPWPHGDRSIAYMSSVVRDTLRGHALFSTQWRNAALFPSKAWATAWLKDQEGLQGRPYVGVNVTSIADLRVQCGFDTIKGRLQNENDVHRDDEEIPAGG